MNTGDRWQQIQDLFAEGLKIPTGERAAWLESRCGDDATLRGEVSSLLAGMEDTQGDFLEKAVRGGHELLDAAMSKNHIGKYEILGKIGQGGFGKVYLGFDPLLKRKVAVKTCTTDNEELRRRFHREGEIAARLQHPNITTVFELGLEDGVPYLTQEFLTGHDLSEVAADLGIRAKVDVLAQVARGLEYAHGQGVLHRDIKPSNLRVLSSGAVKIMDFGIARLLTGADTKLTGTGMTIGTVGYLAPEQLKGGEIDSRADIFAFGVLAYELFTGKRPFVGETFSQVSYQLLYEEPTALDKIWPECPDRRLLEVVKNCLEKNVERRFESMGVVAEFLDSVLATLHASPSTDPTIAMPTPASVADTEELAPTLLDVPSSRELTRLEVGEVPESTFLERAVDESGSGKAAGWKQLAGVALVLLTVAIAAWSFLGGGADLPEMEPADTPLAVVSPRSESEASANRQPEAEGKTVPGTPTPAMPVPATPVPATPVPAASQDISTPVRSEAQPPSPPPPSSIAMPVETPPARSTSVVDASSPSNEPDGIPIESSLVESPAIKRSPVENPPIEIPPVADISLPEPAPQVSEPQISAPQPQVMKIGAHIDASERGVVAPVLIEKVAPVYPPRARRRRIEAHVVVAVYVDENGRVIDKRLLLPDKSNYGFNLAAAEAAGKTKFRPATRDGIAGKMWTEIPFEFRLRRRR